MSGGGDLVRDVVRSAAAFAQTTGDWPLTFGSREQEGCWDALLVALEKLNEATRKADTCA